MLVGGVYQPCRTTGRAAEFFGEMTMNKTFKTLKASNDENLGASGVSFLNRIDRWIKVSGISRSLNQLDDRTLDDIGICRGDIRDYAEHLVDNDNQSAA